MDGGDEAPTDGTYLPPLAGPRAHPRLPARGRVAAAGHGRPGRLPAAGGDDRFAGSVAELLPRRPRALRAALEARDAAPPGRAEDRRRLQGADAARSTACGPPRRPPTGIRRAALHLGLPARRRVRG